MISGGISNALFKVDLIYEGKSYQTVAVRVYGEGSERFVEREREMRAMEMLHDHGFGPKLLGIFGNGRIESFLPMRCLSSAEMAQPFVAQHIAVRLAAFHRSLELSYQVVSQPETPFGRIKKWLDVVEHFDFSDDQMKNATFCTFDFDMLKREVITVEAAAKQFNSPIVFSHNDLLSGNIMVPCSPGVLDSSTQVVDHNKDPAKYERMTFIDFEYADWAPRGFDWGNHFCEYAGFECNYELYPDSNAASNFLKAYLTADDPDGRVPTEAAIRRAVIEANVYALAAHQYWGTWAIMQARWSKIDFDYLNYAKLRWNEYFKQKDEFLQAAASNDHIAETWIL